MPSVVVVEHVLQSPEGKIELVGLSVDLGEFLRRLRLRGGELRAS